MSFEPYALEFMLAHRRLFLDAISGLLPLSPATLRDHADHLDWYRLSMNVHLDWDLALIEAHADRWWPDQLARGLLQAARERRQPELLELLLRTDDARLTQWFDRAELEADLDELHDELARARPPAAPAPALDWTPDHAERQLLAGAVTWFELWRRGGARVWSPEFIERHRDQTVWSPASNLGFASRLDPASVDGFLRALRVRAEPRELGLEAALVANLDDPDGYDVYADWLATQGDAHAELIQLMRGAERGEVEPDVAALAAQGRVARLGIERELIWRRGFVRKAAWFLGEDGSCWREFLGRRSFALVEELRIADGVHGGLGNFEHAPIGAREWAIFARLRALNKLALHHAQLAPGSVSVELPQLEHLDLQGTIIHDFDALAHLRGLRSLAIYDGEHFLPGDLEGLTRLPALEAVTLACWLAPRPDLPEVLGRCEALNTISLLTHVYDVRGFARIPRLRRLIVPAEVLPPAYAARLEELRSERPGLEILVDEGRPWHVPTDEGRVEAWARAPAFFYDP